MDSSVYIQTYCRKGFPGGSGSKESTCNTGDQDSIFGLGRFPGERNSYPFQYSRLGNSRTEEPGGLQSTGSQRIKYNLVTKQQHIAEKYFSCYWIRKREERSKQLDSKIIYFYKGRLPWWLIW